MPWADLTIDPDRVQALAEHRMLDRTTKTFDASQITPALTTAALDTIATKLFDRKVGGKLSQYMAAYGGKAGLLDAIADNADLAAERAKLLTFAFLREYLWAKRNTGRDVIREDADRFDAELNSAIRSFEDNAAFILGQTTVTARTGGGALYSSYSTYPE